MFTSGAYPSGALGYSQILDHPEKNSQVENTLAYFATTLTMKKKVSYRPFSEDFFRKK
jgi:hypothetical protein